MRAPRARSAIAVAIDSALEVNDHLYMSLQPEADRRRPNATRVVAGCRTLRGPNRRNMKRDFVHLHLHSDYSLMELC